jgi:HEAT repeat protein
MTDAADQNIEQLATDLGSKDTVQRQNAQRALVRLGSAAVPALLGALDAPEKRARWEAAKALTDIADPAAAKRLVRALGDRDSDVRWVVGEALVALGRDGVKPLLQALTESGLPEGTYPAAHHVLHELVKQNDLAARLEPVLHAFNKTEPEVTVPLAAAEALERDDA